MPPFLWHEVFFKRLGVELGELVEISPRTLESRDLSEVWLKIDVFKLAGMPMVVSILSSRREFRLVIRYLVSSRLRHGPPSSVLPPSLGCLTRNQIAPWREGG